MSEWSAGDFKSVRPDGPQPLGGLIRILTWSQERAEQKQAELIGMSTVVEMDEHLFSRGKDKRDLVTEDTFEMPLADKRASSLNTNN